MADSNLDGLRLNSRGHNSPSFGAHRHANWKAFTLLSVPIALVIVLDALVFVVLGLEPRAATISRDHLYSLCIGYGSLLFATYYASGYRLLQWYRAKVLRDRASSFQGVRRTLFDGMAAFVKESAVSAMAICLGSAFLLCSSVPLTLENTPRVNTPIWAIGKSLLEGGRVLGTFVAFNFLAQVLQVRIFMNKRVEEAASRARYRQRAHQRQQHRMAATQKHGENSSNRPQIQADVVQSNGVDEAQIQRAQTALSATSHDKKERGIEPPPGRPKEQTENALDVQPGRAHVPGHRLVGSDLAAGMADRHSDSCLQPAESRHAVHHSRNQASNAARRDSESAPPSGGRTVSPSRTVERSSGGKGFAQSRVEDMRPSGHHHASRGVSETKFDRHGILNVPIELLDGCCADMEISDDFSAGAIGVVGKMILRRANAPVAPRTPDPSRSSDGPVPLCSGESIASNGSLAHHLHDCYYFDDQDRKSVV